MPSVNPAATLVRARRQRRFLPPVAMAGFVVAIVVIVLIAWFSFLALQNREQTAQRITRSTMAMAEIRGLLSELQDAETGQRGFLLVGTEIYLDPYNRARTAVAPQVNRLRELLADDPLQVRRLGALQGLAAEKLQELEEAITLRRSGDTEAALALVRTNRGRVLMDNVRSSVAELLRAEQQRLEARQAEWDQAVLVSSVVQAAGSGLLLVLVMVAAGMLSRDYLARETQVWLRAGKAGLGERVQGEQRLEVLGQGVLDYLVTYLDAQVATLYLAEQGHFRRVAGPALPAEAPLLRPGEGLLGQAARRAGVLRVDDVPADYLSVSSSVGRSPARTLLLAPAVADGKVEAIVELAFLRRPDDTDEELLAQLSELLGAAVRSSRDRTRLEELLEETQRQAEELQAQQEELRVNNEELEEQSRALNQSQLQLQNQQAELEQTNAQLEEQAQLLEHQRDELAQSQGVLASKAQELERSNQYKSEFLANMSHELRTPLNSTLILAKLLADNREGNLTAEQVKYADTITSAGNDLLLLINDILDLSKIEAGKMDLQLDTVPLAATVETLVRSLQPQAQHKGLQLELVMAPGVPDHIVSDMQRLGQILKNLVSNALKFTSRGSVTVTVRPESGDRVAFDVQDTGIGIAPENLELIFEAFRQADGSTHRKYGGTGLGLSISRDLAQLLGGTLTVRSTVGEGSTFSLVVPRLLEAPRQVVPGIVEDDTAAPVQVARAPRTEPEVAATPARAFLSDITMPPAPPSVEGDAAAEEEPSHGGRLILVIEDDLRFADILRDLAAEMEFGCVLAHSAAEGLQAAVTRRPSAILLDMHLPDHSGLAVLDQLKRDVRTRHIPVHVLSVSDYVQEALGMGAVGYDLKPVKRAQLVSALQRLEAKFSQRVRRVLVVEDDQRQRESIHALLGHAEVQIVGVDNAQAALQQLRESTFDCMIMDLNLPDVSGYQLLEQMEAQEQASFPPVIVYTGRSITPQEEQQLRRLSRSIIIKDARSPERLLDEVTLFLHQVEANLPAEAQRMLQVARGRDTVLEGRTVLVVEDDVRNIFALTSVLEPKGARVELARNGLEALAALERSRSGTAIDLVLMDIMMPEMDGLTAMREIRKQPEWRKLPIIALTAKAMRDDQERCLAAGANDYIAKPLDVERLLSLVRVWMPK